LLAIGRRPRGALHWRFYEPSAALTHFRTEGALDASRGPANSC
jgi:hypothetical protein